MDLRIKDVIVLLLTFYISLTNVVAQDKLAEEILKKLSNTTKAYSSISIEFEHVFINKSAGINKSSIGNLELMGENFRIDMPGQLIVNNGITHWIYLKDMNELTITNYDLESEDVLNPNKLFTIYDKDYKNIYVQASSANGERIHIIDLFPKESGPIMKIQLTISVVRNQISKLDLHDKNGGIYTYNIKSFKTNQELPPFTIDIANYPEVEVIDLR